MAQQTRSLAALANDLGSVPRTHKVAHNQYARCRAFDGLFWLLGTRYTNGTQRYISADKVLTHLIDVN